MYTLLLNKRVILFRKNGFKFEGKLINFDDKFVVIDDCKAGTTFIAVDEIQRVSEVKKW